MEGHERLIPKTDLPTTTIGMEGEIIMKHIKKILALALVAAMSLSLFIQFSQ